MSVKYFKRNQKPSLAYILTEAKDNKPYVMFCSGYRSDMQGTKAQFLEDQCKANGFGYLRFDYSGHGESEGVFEDFTISDWRDDALAIQSEIIGKQPFIIVGSSMGGWIALLMALRNQSNSNLRGVIGLAAAPDFTEEMFEDRLNADQQKSLLEDGIVYVPNDYSDEPYAFTRAFYLDGKDNLVLQQAHQLPFSLQLIQGRDDKDVPWQTAMQIQKAFGLKDEDIHFIEGGDHRLSSPEHLHFLWERVFGSLGSLMN